MRKREAIALQNRLEYLKDKVHKLDFENRKFQAGLEELQKASEILLKQVAYEYGGDEYEIYLHKRDLSAFVPDVERMDDGTLVIRLKNK